MKIVYIEAGKEPVKMNISGSLEDMQKLVGGHIEMICPFNDTAIIICNDEGKLEGLPLNRGLYHPQTGELYEIIAGNFFICDAPPDSDNFGSLNDEQVKIYTEKFKQPEIFFRKNDKIISIKY